VNRIFKVPVTYLQAAEMIKEKVRISETRLARLSILDTMPSIGVGSRRRRRSYSRRQRESRNRKRNNRKIGVHSNGIITAVCTIR
jgi:hypothetical protein